MDNVESILQGGQSAGQYREGYAEYGRLLQLLGEVNHQSCLLLTSREKPREVARLEGSTLPVRSLQLLGIGELEGRLILKDKGLFGSDESWNDLIQSYSGNPLALQLVSESIREVFGGDVTSFLKKGELVFGDIYDLINEQFHRLSELEQEIMYWLAIEREPVSLEDLEEDLEHPISRGDLLVALGSLRRRSMIEASSTARFTLQPVIMEYMTDEFAEQIHQEIATEAIGLFGSHPLIKAQAKDYVRNSQVRLILKPVAERLLTNLGKASIEKKLKSILSILRDKPPQAIDYAAGNVLNLLIQLKFDLRGYDFSHLIVRQAYLQGVALPDVNFAHADLAGTVFTDTFGSIFSVALDPNGELLAAGTNNGYIRVWQESSGKPFFNLQGHSNWVCSIAFSPDGKTLASGSADQTIRLWDVSRGECLKTLQGHSGWVLSVAFSPDGKTLASGSADQTIRLWDVSRGECFNVLQGHSSWVYSVAFSPDGLTVASSSFDGTNKLWDVQTGVCLKTLRSERPYERMNINGVTGLTESQKGILIALGAIEEQEKG